MSRKRPTSAECSACGRKRRIAVRTEYGGLGRGLVWCKPCSIRTQCANIIRALPENALKEAFKALDELEKTQVRGLQSRLIHRIVHLMREIKNFEDACAACDEFASGWPYSNP